MTYTWVFLQQEMIMNPEIFRMYDIRGIAGKDLDADRVRMIGRAYGTYIRRKGGESIVVGRDCRLTGPEYSEALIDGILSTGCDVFDVGLVPTPLLYFAIIKLGKDAGITVTASHNPPEYSGFKMRFRNKPVFGDAIQEIYKFIKDGDFETGSGQRASSEIIERYIDDVASKISLKPGFNVVMDAGNGTAGLVAPELLKRLGCNVTGLFLDPDGNFPNHLPDPTVRKYMSDLIAEVKKTGADIGIGYDGDADRLGAVDSGGNIVWADHLMILFARQILGRNPHNRNIVFDVKCSQALVDEIEKHNGIPVIWKTGYPMIQDKMAETGALLGGEMSGHIYLSDDFYGFDDGIYASCRLLEIMSDSGKSLSELVSDIPRYVSTPEIRLECPEAEKFGLVEKLKADFRREYKSIEIDGIRVLFDGGWALMRASNTQPVIVFRFEAKTLSRLEEIKKIVTEKVRKYSTVEPSFKGE